MYKMIQYEKDCLLKGLPFMYSNSAYLYHTDTDIADKTKPLVITSCGTYHLRKKSKQETFRPNGRNDYQFLYIASGKAHFFFAGTEQIVTAGHMVFYRPYEEQNYVYYGTDKTEVYWIHFTGNDVEEILKSCNIPLHEHVFYAGNSITYESLYKEIIRELQNRSPQFEELTILYFKQLLLLVQRNRTEYQHVANHSMVQEIELAKKYFHDHYQEAISIEDYASSRHMSTCWFIRSFRTLTGITPLQYILSIRMTNARTLLEHTQYNVTEVAALIGFNDPLHFSHLFKKHTGLSPSEYRKRI